MRYTLLFSTLILFLCIGCKNSDSEKSKKKSKKVLTSSSGSINSLSVIIDDSLWKGEVGENIRQELASPVTGLPQEEPLFSLSHIPPKAFDGFMRTSRLFMSVQITDENKVSLVRDMYARPQIGFVVTGKSSADIVELIKNNSSRIIKEYKKVEVKANQNRISKSLKSDEELQERFGLRMKFPSVYRYAVKEDDFVWLRKDIQHGSMEILVYEVPLKAIDKDTNTIRNIVKMRDSIGKKYVPGPVDDSYMITEEAYAPFLYNTKIDGKDTYLTKGTWEVKGAFMAGPFVNYAIRDEANNRYLVLEGFVFKPQTPTKRNNIFELQSIFRSAKLD